MIRILCIKPHEWSTQEAENAHIMTFGTYRPNELDRIDFTLLGLRDDEVLGYMNCKEMDAETVYIQMGGALDKAKGSVSIVPAFIAGMDWCLERYQRITARIENVNLPMLKIALFLGFRICGTWNFKDKIYLELLKEKEW